MLFGRGPDVQLPSTRQRSRHAYSYHYFGSYPGGPYFANYPRAWATRPGRTQLVGKWEGTQHQAGKGGSEGRTLIISSVTQQEGKWIADGRFGVKGGAKAQIEVDTTGQWPSLRWAMPNGNTVQVNLVNPKTLSGKVTLAGSGQRDRDRTLTLEKVE